MDVINPLNPTTGDSSFMGSFGTSFVILIIIFIILFLLFRWANLWYWKINEMVNLLKEIRDNQKREPEEYKKNTDEPKKLK